MSHSPEDISKLLTMEWELKQHRMAKLVSCTFENQSPSRYFGGVDVTFDTEFNTSVSVAGIVVMDRINGELIHSDTIVREVTLPYIPSFLGFREVPLYTELLDRMKEKVGFVPDVLLVDGNGLLHERKCGSACQLGVSYDIPTIGVGKNYYCSIPTLPTRAEVLNIFKAGAKTLALVDSESGFTYGAALSVEGRKPIFVSIGHRISLEKAIEIVSGLSFFRVPEPLRQADHLTRKVFRECIHMESSGWKLIGSGARHIVYSEPSGEYVVRIQKSLSDNTPAHSRRCLEFHTGFVMEWFRGVVCDQFETIVPPKVIQELFGKAVLVHAIRTKNLLSDFTVEVKPKCALVEREGIPPRFVLKQDTSGPVFDPTAMWNSTLYEEMVEVLRSAAEHPKKYLRVHTNKFRLSDEEVIKLVAISLLSEKGRKILDRLKQLQLLGTDRFATLAYQLLPLVGTEDCTPDVPCDLWSTPEEFYEFGLEASRSCDKAKLNRFIATFLAARMAMDVSLILNINDARPDGELESFPVGERFWCTIGIVDTELKDKWKIPVYATQLDNAIRLSLSR